MKTLARLRRLFYSQFLFVPLSQRPDGISCFTRTRNDEWLLLSVRSVRAFADEVIVIDTVGNLQKELSRLANECDMTIKYCYLQPENQNSIFATPRDFIKQTEMGLQESTYKWIFEWNADFIAVESAMQKLRARLLRLGEREKRHYYFFLPYVDLCGDVWHTEASLKKDVIKSQESFLFRHSKDLLDHKHAKFKVPKYYRPVWLKGLYYFHLHTVKSATRLLYRRYWWTWYASEKYRRDFPALQDFVKSKIVRDFGTTDMQEAKRRCLLQMLGAMRPLRLGLSYYPEVMKENLELFKKYELITSDDSIVSRRDIEN